MSIGITYNCRSAGVLHLLRVCDSPDIDRRAIRAAVPRDRRPRRTGSPSTGLFWVERRREGTVPSREAISRQLRDSRPLGDVGSDGGESEDWTSASLGEGNPLGVNGQHRSASFNGRRASHLALHGAERAEKPLARRQLGLPHQPRQESSLAQQTRVLPRHDRYRDRDGPGTSRCKCEDLRRKSPLVNARSRLVLPENIWSPTVRRGVADWPQGLHQYEISNFARRREAVTKPLLESRRLPWFREGSALIVGESGCEYPPKSDINRPLSACRPLLGDARHG